MKGRLYRFTPAGGKPEHFTHSYESARRMVAESGVTVYLASMRVGHVVALPNGDTWERVA